MKLIIGLGNPGAEYAKNRHNVGFMVLDKIVRDSRILPVISSEIDFFPSDLCEAEVAEIHQDGGKIILVKPQTYMNNSGTAVARLKKYYRVDDEDVWVITDDIDLPLGTIRVRLEGSSGGHNGLESVIESVSSNSFPRIRIGIGQTTQREMKEFESSQVPLDTKKYVLADFLPREEAIIQKTIAKAADVIIDCLDRNENLVAHTYEVEDD